MANTYTLISSNVLSSSAASVTFSSIPTSYTDLVLKVSGRASGTGIVGALAIKFNGSSTNLYSNIHLFAYSTVATPSINFNAPSIPAIDNLEDGGGTANSFSSSELYIPSYTSSQNKSTVLFTVVENNSAANFEWLVYSGAGLYRDTNAISSIALTTSAGNFVTGSSFHLYGIKNS